MCLCLFKSQLSINPYHLLNISYLVTAWSTHNITYHSIGAFRLLVWCDLPIPAKANAMVPTPKSWAPNGGETSVAKPRLNIACPGRHCGAPSARPPPRVAA